MQTRSIKMGDVNRQVVLVSRPGGKITAEHFAVREAAVTEPGAGELLVRNIYLSCDPYLRGLMRQASPYAPAQELNEPVLARAVGEVLVSRRPEIDAGDLVWGFTGWQTHALLGADDPVYPVDPALGPVSHFISILGMPGLTAYHGMMKIGQPKTGETVVVSAAAGAVGQIAGQLAKLQGCRVVGIAGTVAKLDYLLADLGFDAAVNYREAKAVEAITAALAGACPRGIDVYYDNVGGLTLEAALNCTNVNARIVACGMIAGYDAATAQPVRSLTHVIGRRITLQGFVVGDHLDELAESQRVLSSGLRNASIKYREDIREGIENTPLAFIGMLAGDNIGKRLVKVGPDPTL